MSFSRGFDDVPAHFGHLPAEVAAGCARFSRVVISRVAYDEPSAGSANALSVAVVAHDVVTSRRIATTLAAAGIEPTAIATDPDELLHLPPSPAPEVLILACDPSQLAWLRRLRKELHDLPIVLLASGVRRTNAREALNTGADGFVLESELETALATVVRTVAAGQISIPRALRRCVARPAFSHRERQVLALIVEGLQNREIADRLYLAESTVKSHLASSFEKLGVRSRKEAAALVLDPDEGLRALVLEHETAAPTPE